MESEGEEKPLLCTFCGEAFTTTDALDVHKETEHPNEHSSQHCSEFAADRQENKTRSTVAEMEKTSVQNIGELVSVTERESSPVILDGSTFQATEMDETPNETDEETDIKPLICDLCHEVFTDMDSLVAHKEQHELSECEEETDIKPYLCDICYQIFTDMESLVSHKEQHELPEGCEPEDSVSEMDETDEKPELSNITSSGSDINDDSSFANQNLLLFLTMKAY